MVTIKCIFEWVVCGKWCDITIARVCAEVGLLACSPRSPHRASYRYIVAFVMYHSRDTDFAR